MQHKRVLLIAGHYGSGKTNIAVNIALKISEKNQNVIIADLDIVNPYFRTKDSLERLTKAGVYLISSPYANTNLDIPALPQEMYTITHDRSKIAVIDIGGDDRGAFALGRFTPEILQENNYEMLFVINCYRPLTRDAESTIEIMKEIEVASKIPFTAIINNSNLGEETSKQDLLNSLEYAEKVSKISGLPIKITTVEKRLFEELKDKIPNLFPLELQKKTINKGV